MSTATSQQQKRLGDLWWGKALSAAEARRLVAEYYRLTGAAMENSATTSTEAMTMRRAMPSSVMHRLGIIGGSGARERRQQQGLRVQVLAALADLRHLVAACAATGDKQGRVYEQLERLNQLYVASMDGKALTLQLQSAGSVILDTRRLGDDATIHVMAWGTARRRTVAVANEATSPVFERTLYSRRGGDGGVVVDPRKANWVDFLVADVAEAEAHELFRLVARSRVPAPAQPRYRAAVEEALVLAFNRRGYTLEPLESMRVCAHVLRGLDPAGDDGAASVVSLLPLWRHAGRWCCDELSADTSADDVALCELRFKRWNDVASTAIAWLARAGNMDAAWGLVHEWHSVWTQTMRALCLEPRRGFAVGIDAFAFPYWRSKCRGRLRLHELTLSAPAILALLAHLARVGYARSAAELLGLATSEFGVPPTVSVFNVVLRAVACARGVPEPLLPLAALPLANARALHVYRAPLAAAPPLDHALALLRGMARWRLHPDAKTLDALVLLCCRVRDLHLLRAVLLMFSARWCIAPSPHCWQVLDEHGLAADAQHWLAQQVS
ncbi:hypothetical protein COEREDRAFT_86079 [Coemansia reversa NRRL 1564]|uniref:Uncharacterized protein n=1 Tax=Coemansia reversa (strain ATCC 12441 / NRRL 1564) TaxID=763665 RepID=A0A2G5BEN2_COERN|nr:hypothetical protein COEREDRAFT_86079 [Coemansia reversa NRRL 1564]|eukprot:PIA17453.1 hypothetical protein COEREDRAFT_86079 [Coemansia reversa NRRL 1564]